jgi:hypothetical protein
MNHIRFYNVYAFNKIKSIKELNGKEQIVCTQIIQI